MRPSKLVVRPRLCWAETSVCGAREKVKTASYIESKTRQQGLVACLGREASNHELYTTPNSQAPRLYSVPAGERRRWLQRVAECMWALTNKAWSRQGCDEGLFVR